MKKNRKRRMRNWHKLLIIALLITLDVIIAYNMFPIKTDNEGKEMWGVFNLLFVVAFLVTATWIAMIIHLIHHSSNDAYTHRMMTIFPDPEDKPKIPDLL